MGQLGSAVPILAQRVGIGPTVLAAPFVATLADATGLFIYFTIFTPILSIYLKEDQVCIHAPL